MPPFEKKQKSSTATPGILHINIKFDEEESDMLREEAKKLHTSPSDVVRQALKQYFTR